MVIKVFVLKMCCIPSLHAVRILCWNVWVYFIVQQLGVVSEAGSGTAAAALPAEPVAAFFVDSNTGCTSLM